jgi:signal transduction histidine kinase
VAEEEELPELPETQPEAAEERKPSSPHEALKELLTVPLPELIRLYNETVERLRALSELFARGTVPYSEIKRITSQLTMNAATLAAAIRMKMTAVDIYSILEELEMEAEEMKERAERAREEEERRRFARRGLALR